MSAGFSLLEGDGESPHQKCVPFPTLPRKISHTVDHPPPNFYSSLPFQKSIPLPKKDFQVITQYELHLAGVIATIQFLTSCSLYTQAMLIFIKLKFNIYRMLFLALKKV